MLELAQLLCQHSVYLCISYDTDLLALEYLTGFLEHYLCFAAKEPKLVTGYPVGKLLFYKGYHFAAVSAIMTDMLCIFKWILKKRDVLFRKYCTFCQYRRLFKRTCTITLSAFGISLHLNWKPCAACRADGGKPCRKRRCFVFITLCDFLW